MEKEINIAEILKDKPQGTKLYADAFGELSIEEIYIEDKEDKDELGITLLSSVGDELIFYNDGRYNMQGEPILVPSKEMRDWRKFNWKRGDVLVNSRGLKILFDRWANDNYTSFYAKTINLVEDGFLDTNLHTLASEEEAKSFIKCIEEKLGGKLNRETLKIEKAQSEFKDGDIVTMHKKYCDIVFIFNRLRTEGSFYYYAFHALQTNNTGVIDCRITLPCAWTFFEGKMNFATDSEKQQLFGALAKEGKAWDAEKKAIVDLKPKVELRPFDKVLSRRCSEDYWVLNFYSHKTDYYHVCIDGSSNLDCIPYNEETAHLLGTTDEWKGGEG